MAITTGAPLITASMYVVMAPVACFGRRFESGKLLGLGPRMTLDARHLQVVADQRPATRFSGIIMIEDRTIERRRLDVTTAAAIAERASVGIIFLMTTGIAADVCLGVKVLWGPAVTVLTALGLGQKRMPAAQWEAGNCVVKPRYASKRCPARNILVAAVLAVAAEAVEPLRGKVAVQPATGVHPLENLLVASQTLSFRQHVLRYVTLLAA